MRAPQHPVRRCAPCDENWPNTSDYNLCPCCLRNTYASTDDVIPMASAAKQRAERYNRIRAFDAERDRQVEVERAMWNEQMNALLELTPSIPDPSPGPPPHWTDNPTSDVDHA